MLRASRWVASSPLLLSCFSVAVSHCGSDAPVEATPGEDAGDPGKADAGVDAPLGGDSSGVCNSDDAVAAIGACIDGGQSPSACLEAERVKTPSPDGCDVDGDGLDDALEDAMAKSYAPVFAYNLGTGGHTEGDSESAWPSNASYYVESSTLIWRLDADDSTRKTVLAKPTLATIAAATYLDGTATRRADDPTSGAGPNFWLCLNQAGGKYDAAALIPSMDASRNLKDGVDLFVVVHPTSKGANGKFVVLEYMLFYPYNKFTFDTHEGDWEGGAVFVDKESGSVVAYYTDRHPTSDTNKLVSLEGANAVAAKDPATESPKYNVCDATDAAGVRGVRFWDFGGKRHHPVLYVAGGGHASYAYPGATKITGAACFEQTIIRDVHNGNGPKLVPHEGAYYTDWRKTKAAVTHGVHIRNLGERDKLRAEWSGFAGQWGCTYEKIPKSYPGPWDNQRLCRHWLTNDWGAAPPFVPSTRTTCQ